jgi:hypothetical protein
MHVSVDYRSAFGLNESQYELAFSISERVELLFISEHKTDIGKWNFRTYLTFKISMTAIMGHKGI